MDKSRNQYDRTQCVKLPKIAFLKRLIQCGKLLPRMIKKKRESTNDKYQEQNREMILQTLQTLK